VAFLPILVNLFYAVIISIYFGKIKWLFVVVVVVVVVFAKSIFALNHFT